MRTIRAVAFKEIQIYFSSPVAYIVALIFMALSGFFFVRDLGNPFPEASLSNFFQGATFLLIPLAPALTMRLLAEEQKLGTIELLLTSPVRDWEVILGKYLRELRVPAVPTGVDLILCRVARGVCDRRIQGRFIPATWGWYCTGWRRWRWVFSHPP